MKFSQEDLIQIVERSSTLTERLGAGFIADEAEVDEQLVNSRLEKWCQVVAQGNQETFAKRLAWDDLHINTIRRVLGSVRLADEYQPLPTWVETLTSAIEATNTILLKSLEIGNLGVQRCLDSEASSPFEEIYLPFIYVAQQKLIALAGSSYSLLSESAHTSLERCLLQHLSFIGTPTIELEFSIFRTIKHSTLTRWLAQSSPTPIKDQYQAFIKQMLAGGLLTFFQEYSVLARLMATATDLWVEATAEFLRRLESDWSAIEQTFQGKTPSKIPTRSSQQVVAVESAISDLHDRGRSVVVLTFASGMKLIYKPRNLGIEVAYFQLLDWLNKQGTETLLPLKVLKVIDRSTYGWVEYVEHLPCENKAVAQRYYQRAGMLMSLIYTLGVTDLHHDNLIASGEHPVLIDLETVMHPSARVTEPQEKGAGAKFLANEQLRNSVLGSALLPYWSVGQNGSSRRMAYDISGLGNIDERWKTFRKLKWQDINTDRMELRYEYEQMLPRTNAPSLEGVNLLASDYIEDIVDGFQQMYRFLVNHRDAILAADGPLPAFAHHPVRFVFRHTRVYVSVLGKALCPEYLRDGCEHSIELDALSRGLLSSESKHLFWPLLRVEQQALELLDIPRFIALPNSNALMIVSQGCCDIAHHQTVENCFEQPSYNQVSARLQQLNEADLTQQINLIRGALYAGSLGEIHCPSLSETVDQNLDESAPFSPEAMLDQALAIAQELEQRAVRSHDGSATWIGLSYLTDVQKHQLEPLSYDLYDGLCGVTLFLAALAKIAGDTRFRDLALAALQPLRQYVHKFEPDQRLAKSQVIGGGIGLGSIIYTLVQISQFLDLEALLIQDAKQVASVITPNLIAADQKLDIITGSAGAILGLLALYEVSGTQDVLEQAICCGHHLINHRVASDSGNRTWATLDGKLLTGFSHGAAGISYALLRLYQVSGEVAFLETAHEAIAYERSVFIPELGNWPHFSSQTNKKITNLCSWCYGASGIGMARVAGLDILDTDEIRQDIEVAINTTKQYKLGNIDQLCCGNLGRIEFLFTAAQKLSQPQLLETAMEKAATVVARAKRRNTYSYNSWQVYTPGFFQGAAGIGYELLRLAYPDQLPSVLLWE